MLPHLKGVIEKDKHLVHLNEDGRVIIEFAEPLSIEKHGVSAALFFGNVRGVQLMTGRKGEKERILGVRFEDVNTLKRFHSINDWPKELDKILAIVEDLQRERHAFQVPGGKWRWVA